MYFFIFGDDNKREYGVVVVGVILIEYYNDCFSYFRYKILKKVVKRNWYNFVFRRFGEGKGDIMI